MVLFIHRKPTRILMSLTVSRGSLCPTLLNTLSFDLKFDLMTINSALNQTPDPVSC